MLNYPPVSSNMACWNMDHRNPWFFLAKNLCSVGLSSHGWWHQAGYHRWTSGRLHQGLRDPGQLPSLERLRRDDAQGCAQPWGVFSQLEQIKYEWQVANHKGITESSRMMVDGLKDLYHFIWIKEKFKFLCVVVVFNHILYVGILWYPMYNP